MFLRSFFFLFTCVFVFPSSSIAQQSYKFYGRIDIGVVGGFNDRIKQNKNDIRHYWGKGNINTIRQNYTSRLGFVSREKLWAGNEFEARLEGTIEKEKEFSFDRELYVGLRGSFGWVRYGRTRDLINGIFTRVSPFKNDNVVVDKILLAQQAGVGAWRISNSLTYVSPNINGFVGSMQFASKKNSDSDAMKFLLTYDNGPFGIHLGLDKPLQIEISDGKYNIGKNASNLILGSFYDFNSFKFAFELLKSDRNLNSKNISSDLMEISGSKIGQIFSLRIPTYSGEIKLVYVKSNMVFNNKGENLPIEEIGFGYEYFLSKTVFLFGQLGLEKKSNGGHWQFGMNIKF